MSDSDYPHWWIVRHGRWTDAADYGVGMCVTDDEGAVWRVGQLSDRHVWERKS